MARGGISRAAERIRALSRFAAGKGTAGRGLPAAVWACRGETASWLLLIATIAVAGRPSAPARGQEPAPADSVAIHNERAAAFNARQAAIRDSLAAEADAWTYEHRELTVEEEIADLNARILKDPRNGELYNNLGVIYAERGDWLLARDAFIAAVQANPLDADFHRNLGQVLLKLENYDMAIAEFGTYQRLDPAGGLDADRRIAEAWRLAGDLAQARKSLETALAKLPLEAGVERMRAVMGLVQLMKDAGDAEARRAVLELHVQEAQRLSAAAAEDSSATDAAEPARLVIDALLALYIEDARILADSGLSADAGALYEKALALAPERDDLLLAIVSSHLAASDTTRAEAMARQALMQRPQAAGGWVASGLIAEGRGHFAEAIAAYVKALELKPDQRDLRLRVGSLYLRAGDSAKAREYLGEAATDPNTPPEVLYNYAVSLIREQKHSLAIPPLRRAVRVDPSLARAWSALGLCLRVTERYDEAADAYRQAMALAPDAVLAFNLGLSLTRAGKTGEGIAAYEQALALDPTLKEARFNLGKALLDVGRLEEAAAVFEDVLKRDPKSYSTLYTLGLVYYKLGQFQRAVDTYNQALAERETAEALNNLGLAYEKLGKKDEAKKCYLAAKSVRGGR